MSEDTTTLKEKLQETFIDSSVAPLHWLTFGAMILFAMVSFCLLTMPFISFLSIGKMPELSTSSALMWIFLFSIIYAFGLSADCLWQRIYGWQYSKGMSRISWTGVCLTCFYVVTCVTLMTFANEFLAEIMPILSFLFGGLVVMVNQEIIWPYTKRKLKMDRPRVKTREEMKQTLSLYKNEEEPD